MSAVCTQCLRCLCYRESATLCLKYDLIISTVGTRYLCDGFIEHVTLHSDLYSVTYDCRRVRRSVSRTPDIGLNSLWRLRFDFLLFKIFSPAINALEDWKATIHTNQTLGILHLTLRNNIKLFNLLNCFGNENVISYVTNDSTYFFFKSDKHLNS